VDKLFKKTSLILVALIILSSFTMFFAISKSKNDTLKLDFFSCNDIVDTISNLEMNMTSIVYVQNEQGVWEEYQRLHGNENRIWIGIDKIPENLSNAFIAIEDQRFFKHSGVDWKRTGAAFINWLPNVNILSGNQGGSTLTQQLIKNVTEDNSQDAGRKFREIIRALTIEKMISKQTILEAYLNTISLGNGICGVQVAANYYFNKDVSELSLSECAVIAAITKNPSALEPINHAEGNEKRKQLVLDSMYEQKMITYDEYLDACKEKTVIDNSQKGNFEKEVNSYFIDALIDDLISDIKEKYDCSNETASAMVYNRGYKIYASINPKIQNTMEEVYENTNRYFSQKKNGENIQSSMTIMDYQGHIVGIVGGVGEKKVNRSFNRATSAPRQPGSTMKPLGAYTPALDTGKIYYSSVIKDEPLESYYPDGKPGPKEWYGYYSGNMEISKAIERSANTIPCHIVKSLGVDVSYKFLTEKLHLNHLVESDKNLSSLALGGCSYGVTTMESAAAYAIFGNGGKYFEPKTYFKVEKANGEIEFNSDSVGTQVIKPDTATLMNKLLQGVVYGYQGTGRGISGYNKMKVYAKTGTSSESNDLWMVAGTPYYVGSVWYGFDNNGTVYNQAGAANVWKAVMTEVHKDLEYKEFESLTEIEPQQCCKYTGKLKGDKCYYCGDSYFISGVNNEVCDGNHKEYYSGLTSSSVSSATSSKKENTTSSKTNKNSSVTTSLSPSADVSEVSSGTNHETQSATEDTESTLDNTDNSAPITPTQSEIKTPDASAVSKSETSNTVSKAETTEN